MQLLLDAGNRRLKWATAEAGGLDGRAGVVDYDAARADCVDALASQLADLRRPQSLWISCVAGAAVAAAVSAFAARAWALQPRFIRAQKKQAGIVNRYSQPAALGSDRWAALIGAADAYPNQSLIVVDAGSAVTVDLLAGSAFCGGVILPGLRAMRAALNAQTANIDAVENERCNDARGAQTALANDTQNAVQNGVLFAAAGGVNLAISRQQDAAKDVSGGGCKVVLTGGDADAVAPLIETEVCMQPQLVLRGLAAIAREESR